MNVELMTVQLDADEQFVAACQASLAADELSRADRFVPPDVRRRFVVCRGSLRNWLGEKLGCAPAEVHFDYERWGKPILSRRHKSGLHFNVSHSGPWALIALGPAPLGVDFEVPNERINYRAIASQILSPSEQWAWDKIPLRDRDLATIKLWVCKEALLKAMGLGIAEGLQQISFAVPIHDSQVFSPIAIDATLQMHLSEDGTCRRSHWIDADQWHLRLLNTVPGSFASLCTSQAVSQLTYRSS